MELGLTGKVAVITGGSEGIGLACARVLAEEGVRVFVCGRSKEKLEKAIADAKADGLTLEGGAVDVTKEGEFEDFLQRVDRQAGRLDILISNAGRGSLGAATELSRDQWQAILDVNLTAVWNCAKAAVPYLERQGGVILNMSSMSSRVAFTHQGAYPVSKAGVNALTNLLASELAAKGIRVVGIAPGYTETELLRRKYADHTAHLENASPLRRLAKPEEIGKLAAFLVSDCASFITAEVVEISGGAYKVRDPLYSWK